MPLRMIKNHVFKSFMVPHDSQNKSQIPSVSFVIQPWFTCTGLSVTGLPSLGTVDIGAMELFVVGDCFVHHRMFSVIPGLHQLDASSLPPCSALSTDIDKCPLGAKISLVENHQCRVFYSLKLDFPP